ncbi:MAG: S41 family peptidase [Marinifilaceae bacterium]|jgi:carboxyl-terminal processing protease|nr:S41 family peptidase [Marinifilaceae bacterium]
MKKSAKILLPLIVVVSIISGMLLNSVLQKNASNSNPLLNLKSGDLKLNLVLQMIENDYVDTISKTSLVEKAIPALLKDLDPHTVYIPAKDFNKVNDELKGNFGGIGVQFIMHKDTVTVVQVIKGGPSESSGIHAGDRIVMVDDSIIAGKKLKDTDIMKRLKGPKGSSVKLGVKRKGTKDLINFKLTRGSIPVASVDVSYMIDKSIGYIKVSRFAATTYFEFSEALENLNSKGMQKLIVDLRGNSGGYLSEATNMINEFLGKGKMIVYTEGKAQKRYEYHSTGNGRFKDLPINVMIDESSASASEIFAGAIQDNDRGKIIGRRSFGKGLVQEQRNLSDGSALRLTVARYYTPTGRCIQKPYDKGKFDYYNDINKRFLHGELQQADSIHFNDSLKFTTPGGNIVYGGGGIMPDIFVPVDTTGYSEYFRKLRQKGLVYKFAFEYVDNHRKEFSKLKNYKQIESYLSKIDILTKFVNYAKNKGVKRDNKGLSLSGETIRVQLEAYIARNLIDDIGFYPIIHKIDITLKKAKNSFN